MKVKARRFPQLLLVCGLVVVIVLALGAVALASSNNSQSGDSAAIHTNSNSFEPGMPWTIQAKVAQAVDGTVTGSVTLYNSDTGETYTSSKISAGADWAPDMFVSDFYGQDQVWFTAYFAAFVADYPTSGGDVSFFLGDNFIGSKDHGGKEQGLVAAWYSDPGNYDYGITGLFAHEGQWGAEPFPMLSGGVEIHAGFVTPHTTTTGGA